MVSEWLAQAPHRRLGEVNRENRYAATWRLDRMQFEVGTSASAFRASPASEFRAGPATDFNSGLATTFFHYDGINVVAETDSSGAVTAGYLYDDYGQLVSMTRGGATYFCQTNAHGDVVAPANAAGTVVNTYTYDPWGKVLSAAEQVVNPYRYAGYRCDETTGLYYLWTRYYSPGVRRFLTVDLAASEAHSTQELNGYLYVLNNPLGFVDPSGLRPQPSQFGADLAFALLAGGLAGFGPQPAGGGDWLTNWYDGVVGQGAGRLVGAGFQRGPSPLT